VADGIQRLEQGDRATVLVVPIVAAECALVTIREAEPHITRPFQEGVSLRALGPKFNVDDSDPSRIQPRSQRLQHREIVALGIDFEQADLFQVRTPPSNEGGVPRGTLISVGGVATSVASRHQSGSRECDPSIRACSNRVASPPRSEAAASTTVHDDSHPFSATFRRINAANLGCGSTNYTDAS
jgi:hypothetical protein